MFNKTSTKRLINALFFHVTTEHKKTASKLIETAYFFQFEIIKNYFNAFSNRFLSNIHRPNLRAQCTYHVKPLF